jgi:ATP-dependent RNA helicase RhlE
LTTFASLGLAEPLLRAVTAEGYEIPTPIQAQAIAPLREGADLLGCAQTGTGKTAAFALPVLHRLIEGGVPARHQKRHIRALVLSPTRELAIQIRDSFETYGRGVHLRSAVVMGGVGQGSQVRALQQGVDILVATPGRLADLKNQGLIDVSRVEIFVVDEADRMLDMGFLPEVQRIASWLPEQRQTAMFSATMPGPIERLANTLLHKPVRIRIEPQKHREPLVETSVVHVHQQEKPDLIVSMIQKEAVSRAVVFTRTKHGADRVAKQLVKAGIPAEAMHGNKSQNARQRTLDAFRSKRPPILVATDLAARGLDVEDVSHVFNYDLPTEPETYVHRIGRTGRAGATGRAIAFCAPDERKALMDIERFLGKRVLVQQVEGFEPPAVQVRQPEVRPRNFQGVRRKSGFTGARREMQTATVNGGASGGNSGEGRAPRGLVEPTSPNGKRAFGKKPAAKPRPVGATSSAPTAGDSVYGSSRPRARKAAKRSGASGGGARPQGGYGGGASSGSGRPRSNRPRPSGA